MSINECEAAYLELCRSIFSPKQSKIRKAFQFLQTDGSQSLPLEEGIKGILRKQDLSEDVLLKDLQSEPCRTFVCSLRQDGTTAVMRSYETKSNEPLFDVCKIWEAARATSVAATFCDPISIGPFQQKFVDGSFRHNNPIYLADIESKELWPESDRMIISLGTGVALCNDLTKDIKSAAIALAQILTDTEEKNRIFRAMHTDMVENGRLFRFNVERGMGSVGLEDYKAIGRVASFTDLYLQNPDVVLSIKKCAKIMQEGGQRLGYIGGKGCSPTPFEGAHVLMHRRTFPSYRATCHEQSLSH